MKSVSLVLAFLAAARAAEFRLHHRIVQPDLPQQAWSEHSLVSLQADAINIDPSTALPELSKPVQNLDTSLYQVALQPAADSPESEWSISAVKLCHVADSTSQILHLYLSSEDGPYSLGLFVSPIPGDGSCRTPYAFDPASWKLNTTILVQRPTSPPLPELRTPPPLSPEGEVVQPVPEKSFLQKYWMYIAMAIFALLMAGPEEPAGEAQPAK